MIASSKIIVDVFPFLALVTGIHMGCFMFCGKRKQQDLKWENRLLPDFMFLSVHERFIFHLNNRSKRTKAMKHDWWISQMIGHFWLHVSQIWKQAFICMSLSWQWQSESLMVGWLRLRLCVLKAMQLSCRPLIH